uniref:Ycf20-like protein n=1 Tax=Setaria italica TaxID=4555 RepID=K3ZWL1_SETIT
MDGAKPPPCRHPRQQLRMDLGARMTDAVTCAKLRKPQASDSVGGSLLPSTTPLAPPHPFGPRHGGAAPRALPMLVRRGAPPCAPRAPSDGLCGGGGSPAARCCIPLSRACFLRPTKESSGGALRTRLGRLILAAGRELLEKLNSARTNSPTKIFLVLLGFYTANALATILGQTGDWDVLVAGVIVAAIEGIGMLMYRKPIARPPGRLQKLVSMVNYWKAGVCLGLFVDAFKLGS